MERKEKYGPSEKEGHGKGHTVNELLRMLDTSERMMERYKARKEYALQELKFREQEIMNQIRSLQVILDTINQSKNQ